jgi:hypothetical protein
MILVLFGVQLVLYCDSTGESTMMLAIEMMLFLQG